MMPSPEPQKWTMNIPFFGPVEAIMFTGPVHVKYTELRRYILNFDRIVAYKPEDSLYILENYTFAMVTFKGSTFLPKYPKQLAEAFVDNDYYNPTGYIPWPWVMN
jgi:hypothetical protein